MSKKTTYEYGIEITKPWSREMYAFNEITSNKLKELILEGLDKVYNSGTHEEFYAVAETISWYKFGDGFEISDVYDEAKREIELLSNFQLNDTFEELLEKGFVKDYEHRIIGFNK